MILNKSTESIFILLTAVTFVLVSITETLYVLFISNPLGPTWLSGIITSSPFILVLIYSGFYIDRYYTSKKEYRRRILYWFSSSLVAFTLINIIIMITMLPDTLFEIFSWLRWSAVVGSGLGLIIGFFESRSIEKAVLAERKRIRKEKAEKEKDILEYLNATLRHEVLNTASIVIGYSDHLMRKYSDDDTVTNTMNTIKTQTKDMEDVIEDVRVLLESTERDVELKPIDMSKLVEKEIENLRDKYQGIEVSVDSEENTIIKAKDPVSRAFSNLLSNAVEHNDSDNPRIRVEIKKDEDYIVTDIIDNGSGIPESELEHLFNDEIEYDSNHGLGLTISETLIDNYNGSLNVLNTGEDGTTFRIKLPKVSNSNQ